MILNDLFVSSRRLPNSRKMKIIRKAKRISDAFHSIPSDDQMRRAMRMTLEEWEDYKERYLR